MMSRACHIPCWITNKNSNCAQQQIHISTRAFASWMWPVAVLCAVLCLRFGPFSLFFLFLILFIIYFIRFSSMPSYWCVLDKINFIHTNTTPIILSPLLEFFRNAIAPGAVSLSIFSLLFFCIESNRNIILFKACRNFAVMWIRKTWTKPDAQDNVVSECLNAYFNFHPQKT